VSRGRPVRRPPVATGGAARGPRVGADEGVALGVLLFFVGLGLRSPLAAMSRHLGIARRLGLAGTAGLVAAGVAVGVLLWILAARRRSRPRPVAGTTLLRRWGWEPSRARLEGARWASRGELRRLWAGRDETGRLSLGTLGGRRLFLEAGHSLLVVGPTQSGKTTGLAVPALLEWDGPVVATSVKTDLLEATGTWRARLGQALVYDPACITRCEGPKPARVARACWSPLAGSSTWLGARQMAAGLCSVARAGSGAGLDDAGFWYATAEKLLAPLLLAASRSGATMTDVVRWVDTEETDQVVLVLESAGEREALQAAEASFSREERQRSSVYTTAETVLAAFADPLVASSPMGTQLEVDQLVGGSKDTLYLLAPAHEQERLQVPFVCLLRSVLDAAFTASARRGTPLDPPLLVVLDEAANVAPLAGLDGLVATASSYGIQVVTLWQDLAQVDARYGVRAATVVNNHRAKLICSGVTDPSTLDQVSRLVGDADHQTHSTTRDGLGHWSATTAADTRRLAPADALRRLGPREAVLLYGNLLPARIALRPYFTDPLLVARADGAGRPRERRPRPWISVGFAWGRLRGGRREVGRGRHRLRPLQDRWRAREGGSGGEDGQMPAGWHRCRRRPTVPPPPPIP